VSGFAADWLRLREPLDAAARGAANIDAHLPQTARRGVLRVVDLGSGTGANLRYLAPRLAGPQDWLLVDDDDSLLEAAVGLSADWARSRGARWERAGDALRIRDAVFDCRIRQQRTDLSGGLDTLPLAPGCLVSASALLDLVGDAWLDALAHRCRAAAANVLFALSYDGRIELSPPDPDDAWIRALVNRDQRRDKGFGPALGPAAAAAAAQCFAAAGYAVQLERSDWRIAPGQRRAQHAVLAEWQRAASFTASTEAQRIRAWHERRTALVENGRSQLRVGHADLLGTLPDR
jgi:SAM-dependent methyltransferase